MAANTGTSAQVERATRFPVWITGLAAYSIALGLITFIPQLYYVVYALQPHLFPIGPNTNPLGEVWFSYILHGHQGGYLEVDAGTLAGAIEDTFLMGPLYIVTGMGLLRRSSWVVPVGIATGSMIFYAILFFFLSGIFGKHADPASIETVVASTVPYLIYPLWLIPTLLVRRALFVRARPTERTA